MPSKKRRKLPVFLSAEEAERLVAAASCERDKVIILVGLYLGPRVSEICGLRIERIDFARGQLLIWQGKGGKDRYLPCNGAVSDRLKAWIGDRTEGWVFPSPRHPDRPLSTRAVQYMVARAAARAGIHRPDAAQRISPHKLRHTFASRLVERGADIAAIRDLMGHSSVATTQVYLHCDPARLKKTMDLLS